MIEPPPPAIIAGTPYLHPNATPLTLIASVRSQTAASVEATEPSLPSITPALLYRTSSLPNRATASSTTSVSTTLAPSVANSLDANMPMPLAPPVISATFPSRRIRTLPRTPGVAAGTARRVLPGQPRRAAYHRRQPSDPRCGMTELMVVGGERVAAAEGRTFEVVEPATAAPMADVAEAGPVDARRAVDEAVRAFEDGAWPRTSARE